MKYLLDTHTFIWLDSSPAKLSLRVAEIIKESNNQLLFSLASLWEMQIKITLGKLTIPAPIDETVITQHEKNKIELLHLELAHVLELATLPIHHKDPFDRLLIAQARIENATTLSNDEQIKKYPVEVIW